MPKRSITMLLLFVAFHVSAQDAPPSCPKVSVSCPDTVKAGEDLKFTAAVNGGASGVTPTYNWSVSAGSIKSGQGTSTIVVDTADTGGQTITATVDVGGFARECSTSGVHRVGGKESRAGREVRRVRHA